MSGLSSTGVAGMIRDAFRPIEARMQALEDRVAALERLHQPVPVVALATEAGDRLTTEDGLGLTTG